MTRHRWTEEDETLALDLYFRVGAENDAHPAVIETRLLIDPAMPSMATKLSNICRLNHLDSRAGLSGVSAQLRRVWNEYCRDDRRMLWQLKQTPGCDFREACRDIARLRRDARNIIRRRTPPAKVSRREARRAAMHILYAARAQNISAADAMSLLQKTPSSARDKSVLSDAMLRAVVAAADARKEEIETQIADATGRAPAQISDVESAILRAAVAELLSHPQTGRGVIIDEAVEIAKQFGAEGGYKIVNGALDKIAARLQNGHARE
ncbi:MAG: transcription antitermination factor NusB [Gammaproteobacteria bacterium]